MNGRIMAGLGVTRPVDCVILRGKAEMGAGSAL
jgi:hypothetical protein